jgi:hypothetical protein
MNTNRHTILQLIMLSLSAVISPEGNPSEPLGWETSDFPRYIQFRADFQDRMYENDFMAWNKANEGRSILIKKLIEEENASQPLTTLGHMEQFAKLDSNNIVLLHLNGRERRIEWEESKKYFPGHWLYKAGCVLTESISATDTELKVENPTLFFAEKFIGVGKARQRVDKKYYLVMVPMGEDGKKDWYRAEYAQIEQVNAKAKTIRVSRGFFDTSASKLDARKTWVAQMCTMHGSAPTYFPNFSSICPKDKNGKTAGDLWVEEICSWFLPGGKMSKLHGIAFDVTYFLWGYPLDCDVNTDGVQDDGIIDGVNVARIGNYQWMKALREKLGPGFILTGDGFSKKEQRALGCFNGIESEGSATSYDSRCNISSVWNTHLYWKQFNPLPDYSYISGRSEAYYNDERHERVLRFNYGLACVLAEPIPARVGAAAMKQGARLGLSPGWLGKIDGPLVRTASNSANLIDMSWLKANLSSADANIKFSRNEILVESKKPKIGGEMVLELKGIPVKEKDLVFLIELESIGLLEGISDPAVPRIIYVAEDNNSTRVKDNKFGFFGKKGSFLNTFLFFDAAAKGAILNLHIVLEETAPVRITRLSAHSGAEIMIRKFKNGIVVLNSGSESCNVDLEKLVGARGAYQEILFISSNSKEAQLFMLNKAGDKVELKKVTIGAHDAVCLQKQ